MQFKDLLTGNVTKEQLSPLFLSITYIMIFGWTFARLTFRYNEEKYCFDNGFLYQDREVFLITLLGGGCLRSAR